MLGSWDGGKKAAGYQSPLKLEFCLVPGVT